jgi:hypothetical protein
VGSVFLINVPIAAIALAAVTFLLPESRAEKRPGLDVPGIVISGAGLTGLTFGFIKAGQDGWTDATALAALGTGAVVLAMFVAWERLAARRGGGQPLVDLPLFRVAGFRWGTILMTLVSFAVTAPQYFQEVVGASPLGSGVRLLPLIGGMLAGMIAGSRLSDAPKGPDGAPRAPRVSAKTAVTAGFAVMAVGLAIGGFTGLGSSTGFAALWIAVTGLGLGLAMPSALNAAVMMRLLSYLRPFLDDSTFPAVSGRAQGPRTRAAGRKGTSHRRHSEHGVARLVGAVARLAAGARRLVTAATRQRGLLPSHDRWLRPAKNTGRIGSGGNETCRGQRQTVYGRHRARRKSSLHRGRCQLRAGLAVPCPVRDQ